MLSERDAQSLAHPEHLPLGSAGSLGYKSSHHVGQTECPIRLHRNDTLRNVRRRGYVDLFYSKLSQIRC